jgi:hypothetical protein
MDGFVPRPTASGRVGGRRSLEASRSNTCVWSASNCPGRPPTSASVTTRPPLVVIPREGRVAGQGSRVGVVPVLAALGWVRGRQEEVVAGVPPETLDGLIQHGDRHTDHLLRLAVLPLGAPGRPGRRAGRRAALQGCIAGPCAIVPTPPVHAPPAAGVTPMSLRPAAADIQQQTPTDLRTALEQ